MDVGGFAEPRKILCQCALAFDEQISVHPRSAHGEPESPNKGEVLSMKKDPTASKYTWKIVNFSKLDEKRQESQIFCHDPNPGSMTGNAGAVAEGHPSRAKPQNGHIKE